MNSFEDIIIEKSIKTKGCAAEVDSLLHEFIDDSSCCNGYLEKTLEGNNSSKMNVVVCKILGTMYFWSVFDVPGHGQFVQLSSLEQSHVAHLVYSSYLRDKPILTEYFNDLGITRIKADIITYSDMLAEENIYQAKNYFEEVILCAPKTNDWYNQRTVLAYILQDFMQKDDDFGKIEERVFDLDNNRLYYLYFRYDDQLYYWIDVLTGNNVHCSHLESVTGKKVIFATEFNERRFVPQDADAEELMSLCNELRLMTYQ